MASFVLFSHKYLALYQLPTGETLLLCIKSRTNGKISVKKKGVVLIQCYSFFP